MKQVNMRFFAISLTLAGLFLFNACGKKGNNDNQSPATSNTGVACGTSVNLADAEKIQIFPTDHPLNTDISALAKDAKSDAIIANIGGASRGLKADFGSGTYNGAPIGIPFVVVCNNEPKVPINYRANSYDGNYGDESDKGPFPIPLTAPIEGNGNGDSHVIAVDIDNKKLYELYNASKDVGGWGASCGALFDLTSNAFRTAGWTSADGAGLPIFPCLVRYDEVASGVIDHAIRFTLSKSKVLKGYVSPARHLVNGTGDVSNSLPMGSRLRLRPDFDISSYPKNIQVILTAMKKYGIILADIGSDMFISGAPDERWNNDELQKLGNVKASDFIVVQIGTVVTQ